MAMTAHLCGHKYWVCSPFNKQNSQWKNFTVSSNHDTSFYVSQNRIDFFFIVTFSKTYWLVNSKVYFSSVLFVHCGGMTLIIIILTLGPRLTEQELTGALLITSTYDKYLHQEMICVTSAHMPSTKVIHMINSKLNIVKNSPPEDS